MKPSAKIAVCYKPNDANNVPSRLKLVVTREGSGKFLVSEIDDAVGTGFERGFNTEPEAVAYAAKLGFTEVLR